jgi:hypothetical protein
MINLTIENNPSFYFDYREGIKYLRELNEDDYEYPEEKTTFHVYSEFKNSQRTHGSQVLFGYAKFRKN